MGEDQVSQPDRKDWLLGYANDGSEVRHAEPPPLGKPLLRRRSPTQALQYLADKLMTGADPVAVGMTMLTIASQLRGADWPAAEPFVLEPLAPWVHLHGTWHRHATEEPGWREHSHACGNDEHIHDENGFRVMVVPPAHGV